MTLRDHPLRLFLPVSLLAIGCVAQPIDSTAESAAVGSPSPKAIELATPGQPIEPADSAAASERWRALHWAPCTEDPALECGQLSVPMNYQHPQGERIVLATIRARALGGPRKGVVFVNPGGPGGSGVDLVIDALSLFTPLRQNFDVVSFDPRGTNRSAPVECQLELPAPPPAGELEPLAAYNDELGRRVARACAAQNGPLASLIGTNNVARDIDVFRAALGESDINYLGYSYGTALGASYATLFPRRVRAMVLDGNVPPQWFGDYLVELDSEGGAGAELALRRLDQLCSADPRCSLRSRGVVATFDRVVARLHRDPVVTSEGVIDGDWVRSTVFRALYVEAVWPQIVQVLAEADGGDYRQIPPNPAPPSSTLIVPSTYAVVCNDSTTRRPGLDYLPTQLGFNTIYPRFGGLNFGIAPAGCSAAISIQQRQCRGLATWPPCCNRRLAWFATAAAVTPSTAPVARVSTMRSTPTFAI
jgi:pimeloyl-ACP methyl ester carboxylesterase